MRIEPSGPCPCKLMLVGESPGHEEQIAGLPFVGKSGQELWAAMQRFCGLTRDAFYVTNVVKYGLPKNRDPKPMELAEALPEFIDEVLSVRPHIVVTAGAFATRAVLGDVAMADVHGIPHHVVICPECSRRRIIDFICEEKRDRKTTLSLAQVDPAAVERVLDRSRANGQTIDRGQESTSRVLRALHRTDSGGARAQEDPSSRKNVRTGMPRVSEGGKAAALGAIQGSAERCPTCGSECLSFTQIGIYHPAAGLHSKGFLSAFAFDLDRLGRLLRGDLQPWTPGTQGFSEWLTGASMRSCGRIPGGSVVAVDTEGWVGAPKMLSFSHDGDHGYVIRADHTTALSWFAKWIKDKVIVGHNFIHDIPVLSAIRVQTSDHHDTQVLGYHDIIRTGSGVLEAESQNLGTLAYRECGMVLKELRDLPGVDFDTQTIPYTDAVRDYAGMDAIATYRLFRIYEQRGIVNTLPYQIDMGQVPLVERMIATGIPFDLDATMDYYADILGKLEVATADLKTAARRMGNRDFNPRSHPQVRELITKRIGLRIRKRTKGGLASTNAKALADHQAHPFVEQLQSPRELSKLKGTYLEPLLEELTT